jgi:non-heme chloroperoxidase
MNTMTNKDGAQIGASALLSSKIIRNAMLKVIKGALHGICTTHKNVVNEELLALLKT